MSIYKCDSNVILNRYIVLQVWPFSTNNKTTAPGHLTATPPCPQTHYYPQFSSALHLFAIFAVLPRVSAILRERVRWTTSLAFA